MSAAVEPGYELAVIVPTFNEKDNVAPLAQRVGEQLADRRWQLIFVDDDSPDGTAEAARALAAKDVRVTCLRRVGRRGLAGAVIEGALASSAPLIAVVDGDGQHDESVLPAMFERMGSEKIDLLIGSRFVDTDVAGGLSRARNRASTLTNRIVNQVLGTRLTDPLSGCFMVRREAFEAVADRLYPQGFKILVDLIGSLPAGTGIGEQSLTFRSRVAGTSKLDARVVGDFACVLLRRLTGIAVPAWFVPMSVTAAIALPLHVTIFLGLGDDIGLGEANFLAAFAALTVSYTVANGLVYDNRRRRGVCWLSGWLRHAILSAPGIAASMAMLLGTMHLFDPPDLIAGLASALCGLVWHGLLRHAGTGSNSRRCV